MLRRTDKSRFIYDICGTYDKVVHVTLVCFPSYVLFDEVSGVNYFLFKVL